MLFPEAGVKQTVADAILTKNIEWRKVASQKLANDRQEQGHTDTGGT